MHKVYEKFMNIKHQIIIFYIFFKKKTNEKRLSSRLAFLFFK